MTDSDYFPYTPETIREILDQWPQWEAARNKGTLMLHSIVQYRTDPEQTKEWLKYRSQEMWTRPSAKRNAPYQIDDVGTVLCDIDRALASLKTHEMMRLKFHFLYGFQHKEIAEFVGLTEAGIQASCDRAINRMARFLERPAKAKNEMPLPPRDLSYRRKYESVPRYC